MGDRVIYCPKSGAAGSIGFHPQVQFFANTYGKERYGWGYGQFDEDGSIRVCPKCSHCVSCHRRIKPLGKFQAKAFELLLLILNLVVVLLATVLHLGFVFVSCYLIWLFIHHVLARS